MEYERQITIETPFEETYNFIKEVEHLPIWTHFFKNCIRVENSVGEMETLIGKAHTCIREEKSHDTMHLKICSQFEHREENALVTLKSNLNQTVVTFHLKVPPHIGAEQQKKMVLNLENELAALKNHLESIYA